MAPTSYARDLSAVMQRGDLDQMSFGFIVAEDTWDRSGPDLPIRELREVALYDVSAVTMPAYPQTSAAVRSMAARNRLRPAALTDSQRRERRLEDLLRGMAPKPRRPRGKGHEWQPGQHPQHKELDMTPLKQRLAAQFPRKWAAQVRAAEAAGLDALSLFKRDHRADFHETLAAMLREEEANLPQPAP